MPSWARAIETARIVRMQTFRQRDFVSGLGDANNSYTIAEVPMRLIQFVVIAFCLSAADWPQFLGSARNGTYTGSDLAAKWPPAGPPQIWKKDAGAGFSSPVVSAGKVILFHRRGGKEVVDSFDAK